MLELSDEQRARILANQRAAKARLARKSVLERKSPGKKKTSEIRLPLADLDGNATRGRFPENAPGVPVFDTGDFDDFDDASFEEIDKLCAKKERERVVGSTSSDGNCDLECQADMPPYLRKLNDSQRDAALSDINKPLLIVAGPGSGKTSTMVARVLALLSKGVDSKNILGLTFTTAAATEMMDRVSTVVGKELSKELTISTFHSFCLQLCRSHAEKLDRTSEFLIYGTSQQRKAVIEATRLAFAGEENCDALKPDVWRERAKKWQQFVTQAKASGQSSKDIEQSGNVLGASVLKHYENILATCNSLDYHDFIGFAVKLLTDYADVLVECNKSWSYILVDEFQDTSVMQYKLLRLLSSHGRVTVVGDDDQSIFSFNGANALGFSSFRNDFPKHKEVRLHQNYRSTGCIVEAARSLIQHNGLRCSIKYVQTENDFGEKIVVMECRNEQAQCAYVVDEILEKASVGIGVQPVFSDFAILYRRQVTGKLFQSAFRARKIPFNLHGVAVYRKKVVKNVIGLLWTSLGNCGDIFQRRVFKALYGGDKDETKKAVEYLEKHSRNTNCSFLESAKTIFTAKVSGTFNRRQLSQGRKVLTIIEMVTRLVAKEQSLSSVMTAVLNMLPQRRVFEARAIVDESGGKLLNEDEDPRTVLEYLLDDVSSFLSTEKKLLHDELKSSVGCSVILKAFLDHITVREAENFRIRKEENHNSVTLTTMHQSKGLEWNSVFIVKANEMETPLLHESASLEEERRLFYVAMTRAREKLYIVYVVVSPQKQESITCFGSRSVIYCFLNSQILQPTRFLSELPRHLLHFEGVSDLPRQDKLAESLSFSDNLPKKEVSDDNLLVDSSVFLKGFNVEARSTVASLFHFWAKKAAFQDPKRLLTKVGLAIDERLRSKTVKNKDTLHALKCSLRDEAALAYADQVVKWEKLPAHERSVLTAERQDYFQQRSSERAMNTAPPTSKQISFLQSLGCMVSPTSRLHASKLIEQYKAL